ncbi:MULTISPECIES: AI-2E family transporter [unclassified Halorhabdus]|uniref:AI-2E family transporter n=1 Tax=unclassified Halorhabdus TaxID=2621901 RepID=UPI0023D98013|nr:MULTISPECIES: AI-2E family transporter [unclassified Halorhabdus]WEL18833.1 Putative PurR-regulated permease PerM [Halorhabdus sp. SVX81]WEL22492.1 Putative PurR-regulated permease PerM [Halorhabdus sp. BNX81]
MPPSRRVLVLVGLFGAIVTLAVLTLWSVFWTVFFAITVAYVLYPVRRRLSARGVGPRVAAGLSTAVAFVVALGVLTPLGYAVYVRRSVFFELIENLPEEFSVTALETTYTVDLSTMIQTAQQLAEDVAISAASAAPALALKFFLFVLLVYALLLKPTMPARALRRTVPVEYHDIVEALHERLQDTLFGLYVLQGATGVGTFLIALPVFFVLGYDATLTLAVLSGVLQFVPIIGPSVLIGVLVVTEVLAENVTGAILVGTVGLVFVAGLPDVLIRPRLSEVAADLPGSLYFIGFTGGILSTGAIGIIAGPVVVALLAESVELLASEQHPDAEA